MSGRIARAVFVLELLVLVLPAAVTFVASFTALSELANASATLGGPAGAALSPVTTLGLFALAFSSFGVLAVRYLYGGGESAGRVTPAVWALAVLGQAITLTATVWTGLVETAPNAVRSVALLTFPALGMLIPLVHVIVAVLLARRERDGTSPA